MIYHHWSVTLSSTSYYTYSFSEYNNAQVYKQGWKLQPVWQPISQMSRDKFHLVALLAGLFLTASLQQQMLQISLYL